MLRPRIPIHIHHAVFLEVAQDLEVRDLSVFILGGHFGSHLKIVKISILQDISNGFLNPQMIGIAKSSRKVMPSSSSAQTMVFWFDGLRGKC